MGEKRRTYTEVYRPKDFSEIIDVRGNIRKIKQILQSKVKQHFLLIGPAGTGKTSTAWVIAREFIKSNTSEQSMMMSGDIDSQIIYINASDAGIETIRSIVKPGVSISGANVFILDEFDGITKPSQHALRPIMEEAEQKISPKLFILTANYANKIIAPISSRCGSEVFMFPKIPFQLMLNKLKEICKKENIVDFIFPPDIIDQIDRKNSFNQYWQSLYVLVDGDMRKALKHLQNSVDTNDDGTKKLDMTTEPIDLTTNAYYLQLDDILLADSQTDYTKLTDSIEELIYRREGNAWESSTFFKETFRWLKQRANRFNHNVILDLAEIIAEYEFRMGNGAVELQSQLIAMISKMRKTLLLDDLEQRQKNELQKLIISARELVKELKTN